jgi:Chemotaxis protein; stimulates methylation of MCP proteins
MGEPKTFFLHPGYIFASQEPHLIHTVLGSCVAVCLWDSKRKWGGICHYILSKSDKWERSGKYGEVAIPHLIRLLQGLGSNKVDLRAHIAGGSDRAPFDSAVGIENVNLADELMKRNRIAIATMDVKGQFGRKLVFNSGSGEIFISRLNDIVKEGYGTDLFNDM